MTSERASHANRCNSRKSTGPRTSLGKARSKQNALQHGLSVVEPNSQAEAEIEYLAVLIVGDYKADAVILAAARTAAEAQVYLQRVRAFGIAMLRSGTADATSEAERGHCSSNVPSPKTFVELEKLSRYEARALSRRKFAFRRFLALVNREQ